MYKLNEIIETKKPHVCGSKQWEIIRIGADIKIKCCGCERVVMLAKYELDKRIKIKGN